MNEKLQVKIAAGVAVITSFIGYVAGLPAEQQNALMGPIVAAIPLAWRPEVGLVMKAIFTASLYWALYKASHSGPTTLPTPPVTPPPATPKTTP